MTTTHDRHHGYDAVALEAFLKSDRQWRRAERLAHAKYQIRQHAHDAQAKRFWRAVLKANHGEGRAK